jgi:hypothetical protein
VTVVRARAGVVIAIVVALASCGGKKDAPASGSASGSGSGGASGTWFGRLTSRSAALPPECTAWKDAMDRLTSCASVPADARDALAHGFAATTSRWSSLGADDLAALGATCASGLQGIRAQLDANHCP